MITAYPPLGATCTKITDLANPPQKRGVLFLDGDVANAPFSASYGSCGLFIGDRYPLCIVSCVNSSGLSIYARSANGEGTAWSSNSTVWVRLV